LPPLTRFDLGHLHIIAKLGTVLGEHLVTSLMELKAHPHEMVRLVDHILRKLGACSSNQFEDLIAAPDLQAFLFALGRQS
jgi:hypothetical protein